jgi:glyoxylase-like metal-dependent hydrolase (beta-lactamase superfamily II)
VWRPLVVTALTVASGQAPAVQSYRVQGNVWVLVSGTVNAAVQIGDEGVLVVDTMTDALAEPLVAEIKRLAGDKPIRWIVNTHAHPDHTGGNAKVAAAGRSIIAATSPGRRGRRPPTSRRSSRTRTRATGWASRSRRCRCTPRRPKTFFGNQHEFFFNDEAVQLIHVPNAHTDGDVMVFFRKSDVLVAGDVYVNTTFPVINVAQGGSINGILASLNKIIDITVPRKKQEGGTFVIPGHGRLADEADVVEYRDMATIIRDRFADAAKRKQTLAQVKTARLVRDYEGRYGAARGSGHRRVRRSGV